MAGGISARWYHIQRFLDEPIAHQAVPERQIARRFPRCRAIPMRVKKISYGIRNLGDQRPIAPDKGVHFWGDTLWVTVDETARS